ncbi:MAG TPA: serine acetyltransferase [Gemmatimonadaceae bacterium]|nr:serine acetyltransferase [Gemmatimonadaceae bacterium]
MIDPATPVPTAAPAAPESPASPTSEWLDALCRERAAYNLPPRANARAGSFADGILAFLFPHFAPRLDGKREALDRELAHIADESQTLFADFLTHQAGPGLTQTTEASIDADGATSRAAFVASLPALREALLADAHFLVESDPAATSVDEVILAYPGFYATACYRVAHRIRALGIPLLPRLITEHAHMRTGIDIHPGATIGVPFAIDHGTGIVIGETATVGVRVRMYQGVTLGALSVEKALASAKRHPTIGDDVVLYANATVLGGRTVVGAGSVVGGNVWLTKSVAAGSTVLSEQRGKEEGTGDGGRETGVR